MTATILTNLSGRRFGNLMAVAMLPRAARRSTAYWKCRCTCGGLAVVSAVQLLHGARKTCGSCRKSGGANQMKRIRLKNHTADPNPTLAERIAQALGGNGSPIISEALNVLFSEVADALLDAEQLVNDIQARTLDPANLDPGERSALDDAIWRRDKLQAAVQALRQRHQQILAQERQATWNREADAIEARRDELTEEFAERYPDLIASLIELFQRVRVMDAAVDQINGAAPNNESRRLLPVGVRSDIAANSKLLGLSGQLMWPVPAPILPEQVMPQLSHPGSHWWQAIQQRDQERHLEAQRVANFYKNQQEQREQRDAASARAARNGNGAAR